MKIVLNTHSFIDIITNSSTEIFVCHTDKEIHVIEEILKELLSLYNRLMKKNYDFEDCFAPIEKRSQKRWEQDDYGINFKDKIVIKSASDNTIPYALWEFIEEAFYAERYHLG